jgi:hypothetical protein
MTFQKHFPKIIHYFRSFVCSNDSMNSLKLPAGCYLFWNSAWSLKSSRQNGPPPSLDFHTRVLDSIGTKAAYLDNTSELSDFEFFSIQTFTPAPFNLAQSLGGVASLHIICIVDKQKRYLVEIYWCWRSDLDASATHRCRTLPNLHNIHSKYMISDENAEPPTLKRSSSEFGWKLLCSAVQDPFQGIRFLGTQNF